MSKLATASKKTVYRSHIPNFLKNKMDDRIPLSFPIAVTYKNSYSSLSEKQRHLNMIEEFYKLRYLIALDPGNEFNILKEFMSKIGIKNPLYGQSHYLTKLSEFFNGEFTMDPNKTLQEVIISVLESNFIPISNSSSSSLLITRIMKENLYVSPNNSTFQEKKQCNQCLRKSSSQKNYEMPLIFSHKDPYGIITLSRQLKANNKDNDRFEQKNSNRLAKELEEEIAVYRRKPLPKTKDSLLAMMTREKSLRDMRLISKANNDDNVNESFQKENKTLLYVTQNVYSRNSSKEPSLMTNELNKIEDGDTKRIVRESMKLLKETDKTPQEKKEDNAEVVIKRLYNPKLERLFNEYEVLKKNKKLTEVILLERINRKLAIDRLKKSIPPYNCK